MRTLPPAIEYSCFDGGVSESRAALRLAMLLPELLERQFYREDIRRRRRARRQEKKR